MARACRAACWPTKRTRSMLNCPAWSAPDEASTARAGSAYTCADRSAVTAAMLAVAGWKAAVDDRICRGSALRTQATRAEELAGRLPPIRPSSSLVSRCSKR